MKIQCQSCQAKYTIADEKVLGKVVKIRCKKCSSTIVVNGNELARGAEEGGATQIFDYAGAPNEQWTVNVADGDQRTMSPQEIAVEYRNGTINDETYCWKEDMADWLPLREIEALYALVGGGEGAHEEAPAASIPPAAAPLFGAHEPEASPFGGYANGNGSAPSAGGGLFSGSEEPAYAAPAPSAARRGGRGQGADLFGNVERAGGDEDVMTSAQAGGSTESDKLTGQRNENSVLFSLSALTDGKKNEPAPSRTTATGEGSGLIDIRALSQSMGSGDDKKDSRGRVDDIMNLSGGGAFGAALAAPILAPPPMDLAMAPGPQEGKSNKTLLFGLIGGGAFIAVAIVLAAVLSRGSSDEKSATKDSTEAPASTAVAANNAVTAPPAETHQPAPVEPAAAAAPAAAADDTPPPPGVGQATGGAKHTGGAAPKVAAAAPKPAAEPEPKHTSTPDPPKASAPKDFGAALAAAAGKPANEAPKESSGGGGGGSAPFDRGAAAAALSGVNVQACKKPGGPTGSGHVKVTFAPNGSVSSAVVDDSQYPGTPVGGCVAGKFRGAHIPAFSGSSVTVGKSFNIN